MAPYISVYSFKKLYEATSAHEVLASIILVGISTDKLRAPLTPDHHESLASRRPLPLRIAVLEITFVLIIPRCSNYNQEFDYVILSA